MITQKGRGYPPAEDDDEKHLHDAPVFDPLIGPPKAVPTGYTQAFAEAIIKEAEADDRVVAITAAMAGPTGLLPFQARFPERFFDVGIAEQHAVTGAAGMAMGGLRPVVAIYSTFLNRAWDQVVYDVALHRLPVVFCLDRAGITGPDGASHHGVYDMAMLARVPGMRVLAPSSAQELQQMLHDAMALADGGPVVLRYPRGQARQVGEHEVGVGIRGPPDPRRRQPRRRAVCVLAIGKLVEAAEKAAEALAADGIDVTVWDVRCCAPLDDGDARRRRRPPRRRDVRGRRPRRWHRDDDRRPHRCPRPRRAGRGARHADAVHRPRRPAGADPRPSSGSTPTESPPPCGGSAEACRRRRSLRPRPGPRQRRRDVAATP